MNGARSALVKALGTICVCGLIWWALQNPDKGMLREVMAFGPIVGVTIATGFFALVAAYARDLQRLLQSVPEQHRAARPASVWWMLLIPYNFTEDFFIIENIARSLARTAAGRPQIARTLGRFGRLSGLGWCALQIVSLIPHDIGSLAGVLAMPLWLWHWRFVRRARMTLAAPA